MDPYIYHELAPSDTQAGAAGGWDQSFNEFVDFGSPKPGEPQSTTNSTDLRGAAGTRNGPSRQWLTVPRQDNAVQPDRYPGGSNEISHTLLEATNAKEVELQRQIDDLRAMVSVLIKDTRRKWDAPEWQVPPPAERSGHVSSRPSTRPSSGLFESFSVDQINHDSSQISQGWCTPLDPLGTPLEPPDDSPIYSRRGSAASVGSIATKRGQRISGGYPCGQCDSRFDVPSQLRHHERKHTPKGERPHACTKCGERFLFPKDVARHDRQVHSTSRSQLEPCNSNDAKTPNGGGDQRSPAEERKRRKRHLHQQQQACRTEYVKQLESAVRTVSHNNWSSNNKRDSGIGDMDITLAPFSDENGHIIQSLINAHNAEPEDQQHVASQIELRRLEQSLQQAEETSQALRAERDAFVEIFSKTAIFPGLSEDMGTYQSTTVSCARGWLGAIEALLSSSDSPQDTHESHIADAVNLIASALGNIRIQDAAG